MKSLNDIAAELLGYDPAALPAGKVNEFLAALVQSVPETEELPLAQALDRVLAQDVISPISVPPHDNSAMDGFVFAGAQMLAGQTTRLKIIGTALAGKAWQGRVGTGECVKIMTGAIMPEGLDTVVPQEMCSLHGEEIEIPAGILKTGDNRRFAGEDLMAGSVALSKGELLAPAALGLLASLNISSAQVYRQLKVAYFSTGDEVLSLGDVPREGAIYDSNRYTVIGMLKRWGYDVIDMGVVRDSPEALEAAFMQAAAQSDAVITSGGVSVGEADHTKAMMKKLGDVAFWKIAMRPGRPMAVGRISSAVFEAKTTVSRQEISASSYQNNSILFGLPGNPVATMVTMLAFVRPALLRMSGANPQKYCGQPLYLQAASLESLRKKPGRTEYQRGLVTRASDGSLQVRTTSSNQGSGVLSSMVQANGLIVLHHEQGNVSIGEKVDVMMFEGVM
ncbi:gephyrin-like molybdotransferase Glp [Variovorax sp. PCZ-1]|uniref:molybdopterin molybdotransferase MoeA n=1 Tax=Variovorax sp. PCZ-1 TaxID=2835533 RepID=UPI001BCBC478|nr:gephyrin-like molybdotransferase Glp [Variovorax sp. PCZ-1]MBS7806899.1 molybdopterin molybdotransferase MoeA [Variovorax sp. PCZ-1]